MKRYSEDFRAAMRSAGLDHPGEIIPDGKLHRFKAIGDRRPNSWYVLHAGPPGTGVFGCWRLGIKETWSEKCREHYTDTEWQVIREGWRLAEIERERAEIERQAKARQIAAWILSRGRPVIAHNYLETKGVKIFGGLREYRGALVLPLWDTTAQVHSLQFIKAGGEKLFLSGGKIAGCYFTLADKPDGPMIICEGYATGASIYEATGFATVCALNCGNFLAVAKTLRQIFPSREIIVAADDDAWTNGNPGITKATEAAKVIGAKLALPQFKDTAMKPTDFNDLASQSGFAEVKRQIESAAVPKESDDEILKRLVVLPPLEYERQRKNAAKLLGCRPEILDKLIDSKRLKQADHDLQGRTVMLPDVEPWPEPVDGAAVLSGIAESLCRYVVLPLGAAETLALWMAHAHCFEFFMHSPRLNIASPEKGCGKTTLRDVISIFVPRPLLTENLTIAVLFRLIESHKPTVLADECDGWLKDNEDLRSMLNSGHRRGGSVFRCEGDGHEVRGFQVFTPAVLCGIGSLPATLHDRSIVIRLERAKPGEVRQRFDSRHTEREQEFCRKLARFIADNSEKIAGCDPTMPDGCFNRLADNWRPLFAIAKIAGGDWPQRAADAFVKLTSREDSDAQGIGTVLLADIADIFTLASTNKLQSAEIVDTLAKVEGRDWAEWGKTKKPISPNQLAKLLRRFNIAPRTIKLTDGSTAKGYHLDMFDDAFARYLPNFCHPKRHPVTTHENISDSVFFKTSPAKAPLRIENDTIANKDANSDVVTDQKPGMQESEALLL